MTRKSVYRTRVRRCVCSARAALLLTPHPPTAPPNPFPVLDYFDEEEDARITFSAADDVQAAADIAAEALPHTAWMARAQADAARKGVPLKQFLDDHSHVKDSTRDSYHKAIQHFQETVIAVMFPGVDMLDLGLEQLAAAVEVHMTGLMTQSMSGRFKSVIETFSAAMNFKLFLADRVALNPFTLQKIKNSKKAKFKLQNKNGDSKKQAPCLSDDEYGFANLVLRFFFKIEALQDNIVSSPTTDKSPCTQCGALSVVPTGLLWSVSSSLRAFCRGLARIAAFLPKIALRALQTARPRTHAQSYLSRARPSLNLIQTSVTVSPATNFPRAVVPRA